MRKLNFRAWDGEQMHILENSGLQYFDFEGNYSLGFTVDGYSSFWAHEQYDSPTEEASKFPIMQHIGLKDKDGKDIFEGDILKTQDGIASVIWDGISFALLSPGSEAVEWENSSVYEKSEIIGNIYENKELL